MKHDDLERLTKLANEYWVEDDTSLVAAVERATEELGLILTDEERVEAYRSTFHAAMRPVTFA